MRMALPNARIMIHQPSGGAQGAAGEGVAGGGAVGEFEAFAVGGE